MVYDGNVVGRMSPSYPVGSQDWVKVQDVINELTNEDIMKDDHHHMIPVMLTKDSIIAQMNELVGLAEERPSSEKARYRDIHTGRIPEKMTGLFEFAFFHLMDDLKLLCDYHPVEGIEACAEALEIIDGLESDDDYFVENLREFVEGIRNR